MGSDLIVGLFEMAEKFFAQKRGRKWVWANWGCILLITVLCLVLTFGELASAK